MMPMTSEQCLATHALVYSVKWTFYGC